jgi:WD40 repeat protein
MVRLLESATGREVRAFRGHLGPVASTVFSEDSQNLLATGADGTLKVWAASASQENRTFLTRFGMVFLPDQPILALEGGASLGKGAWLADAAVQAISRFANPSVSYSYLQPAKTPEENALPGEITRLAFTPDGTRAVVSLLDRRWLQRRAMPHRLQLVEWDSRHVLAQFTLPATWNPETAPLVVSPDGQLVATVFSDAAGAVVLDTASNQVLFRLGEAVACPPAFSPDGRYLATARRHSAPPSSEAVEDAVRLRDAKTGAVIRNFAGALAASAVVFSPDGKHVAAAANVKEMMARERYRRATVYIWEVETGILVRTLSSACSCVAFSPDGTRLATGSPENGTIKLWDTASGELLLTLTSPDAGQFIHVAFRRQGDYLAAMDDMVGVRRVVVWQGASNKMPASSLSE